MRKIKEKEITHAGGDKAICKQRNYVNEKWNETENAFVEQLIKYVKSKHTYCLKVRTNKFNI